MVSELDKQKIAQLLYDLVTDETGKLKPLSEIDDVIDKLMGVGEEPHGVTNIFRKDELNSVADVMDDDLINFTGSLGDLLLYFHDNLKDSGVSTVNTDDALKVVEEANDSDSIENPVDIVATGIAFIKIPESLVKAKVVPPSEVKEAYTPDNFFDKARAEVKKNIDLLKKFKQKYNIDKITPIYSKDKLITEFKLASSSDLKLDGRVLQWKPNDISITDFLQNEGTKLEQSNDSSITKLDQSKEQPKEPYVRTPDTDVSEEDIARHKEALEAIRKERSQPVEPSNTDDYTFGNDYSQLIKARKTNKAKRSKKVKEPEPFYKQVFNDLTQKLSLVDIINENESRSATIKDTNNVISSSALRKKGDKCVIKVIERTNPEPLVNLLYPSDIVSDIDQLADYVKSHLKPEQQPEPQPQSGSSAGGTEEPPEPETEPFYKQVFNELAQKLSLVDADSSSNLLFASI
jgi:hypothetical protein